MSEALTQEEIDAILKGSKITDVETFEAEIDEEAQALLELGNISMNALSDVFLAKLDNKTAIQAFEVVTLNDSADINFEKPIIAFKLNIHGGIDDKTILFFETDDVNSINGLLFGEEDKASEDLRDIKKDVLLSIVKDSMTGYAEKMSSVLSCEISVDTPEVIANAEGYIKSLLHKTQLAKIIYELEIGNKFKGKFYQLFPTPFVSKLVRLLVSGMGEKASRVDTKQQPNHSPKKSVGKSTNSNENPVTVRNVSFPSFDDDEAVLALEENIEFILDVPLHITVELGGTEMPIKDILSLNIGSIIELDNLAEDLVEILVNGKLIARGEVIVVDENFGIRIRELYTNNQKSLLNGAFG